VLSLPPFAALLCRVVALKTGKTGAVQHFTGVTALFAGRRSAFFDVYAVDRIAQPVFVGNN